MGSRLITPRRARVLPMLPATVPELMAELSETQPRMRYVLVKSERDGLVARAGFIPANRRDQKPSRRAILWSLTDKGRRALERAALMENDQC